MAGRSTGEGIASARTGTKMYGVLSTSMQPIGSITRGITFAMAFKESVGENT